VKVRLTSTEKITQRRPDPVGVNAAHRGFAEGAYPLPRFSVCVASKGLSLERAFSVSFLFATLARAGLQVLQLKELGDCGREIRPSPGKGPRGRRDGMAMNTTKRITFLFACQVLIYTSFE